MEVGFLVRKMVGKIMIKGSGGEMGTMMAGFVAVGGGGSCVRRRNVVCRSAQRQSRYPAAERIVSIGDVHGDLAATMKALRIGELITPDGNWIGGETVLVQVGDVFDRGNAELEILELLWNLKEEAIAQGGNVHMLLGNHELLNVALDFSFVSPEGFEEFSSATFQERKSVSREVRTKIQGLPDYAKSRAMAMQPGGEISTKLASQNVMMTVGRNLFVHGGLTSQHLRTFGGMERLNATVQDWLLGKGSEPKWLLRSGQSPIWMRDYSTLEDLPDSCAACNELKRTLDMVGADRMVVGHTPHESGANSACQGRIWRIDTGMSFSYNGVPEVLEIRGEEVRVLTAAGAVLSESRSR